MKTPNSSSRKENDEISLILLNPWVLNLLLMIIILVVLLLVILLLVHLLPLSELTKPFLNEILF